jgi:hypothetical protein
MSQRYGPPRPVTETALPLLFLRKANHALTIHCRNKECVKLDPQRIMSFYDMVQEWGYIPFVLSPNEMLFLSH